MSDLDVEKPNVVFGSFSSGRAPASERPKTVHSRPTSPVAELPVQALCLPFSNFLYSDRLKDRDRVVTCHCKSPPRGRGAPAPQAGQALHQAPGLEIRPGAKPSPTLRHLRKGPTTDTRSAGGSAALCVAGNLALLQPATGQRLDLPRALVF
jgi:hypothetical protein